jgi:4-hydroxythreonine-4-phosphate dehydrogenase
VSVEGTSASDPRPILAITPGDPAGIGPEIVAKALRLAEVYEVSRPLVVGDAGVLRRAVRFVGGGLEVRSMPLPEHALFRPGAIDVLDLGNVDVGRLEPGRVSAVAGRAAFEAVKAAIELALSGEVAAVVTGPIHKEALRLAGLDFPGHTEIFARFTGTTDYAMMLAEGSFRVVHVSTHVSLREACERVSRARVLRTIELAHDACRRLGIARPRIAVAGLNPHASDGGLFGSEERNHIGPAIEDARAKGFLVEGPLPADTLFPKAAAGAYDVAVAMYHDQGHIPVKLAGFRYDAARNAWESVRGINVSLGLPILRVSVDHGTAFDQAGKGTASEESLLDAIRFAARMARGIPSERANSP